MLKERIGGSPVVTFIGLCKNAGKTTALRRLMAELADEPLGLTSVGRDGEATDLVTGTAKPDLYLKAGDLFATARGMLPLCDATCAVESLTGVRTPLGEVAVFRTLSDGFVQLAGPSAAGQLPPLVETFQRLGAKRVLIDGAAGRKSLAGAGAAGCAILCTGASLDREMAVVAAETAYVCDLFSARVPPSTAVRAALEELEDRFALFTPRGEPLELPLNEGGTPNWGRLPRGRCALWVGGAVTDPLVKALARRDSPTELITENPTHVLAGREAMALFRRAGGTLWVRRPLKLAAVCANPWSACGRHFDPAAFAALLRESISLPVCDVREEAP